MCLTVLMIAISGVTNHVSFRMTNFLALVILDASSASPKAVPGNPVTTTNFMPANKD